MGFSTMGSMGAMYWDGVEKMMESGCHSSSRLSPFPKAHGCLATPFRCQAKACGRVNHFAIHRSLLKTHFSPAVTCLPSCYGRMNQHTPPSDWKRTLLYIPACSHRHVYVGAAYPSRGRRGSLPWQRSCHGDRILSHPLSNPRQPK